MSIKVANLVRSRIIGSAALKAVLLNMAYRASDDGEVYSSKETMAAETELSRATVFRAVNQLVSLGLICADRGLYRISLQAIGRLPEIRRADL